MKPRSPKTITGTVIIDTYIPKYIENKIIEDNRLKRENHKSSGKLSASMLGQPLQWQILKKLGIPEKKIDAYTLKKFLRGEHVEEWFVSTIPGIVEKQKFCEYRNTIGYADTFVDTKDWDFKLGIIPLEVKSVANAKFKRIMQSGEADRSHKLQNGLYALANESEYYAIAYIAADDYRVSIYIYETKDIKDEVDMVIDRYQKQGDKVPVFEAEEVWQANPKYSPYPDWIELTEEEIINKLNQK